MTWNEVLADESALEELIEPEQFESLRMAIKALPEIQESIILGKLKGNTLQEIADELNISIKRVKYESKKALDELKWKLKFWEN